jgi:hypothetical protein
VKNNNTKHEEQTYQIGRKARIANLPLSSCNLHSTDPEKCWWVAGWHDQDMEFGVRVYVNKAV